MRIGKVNRKAKETSIEAEVNLDGKGVYKIDRSEEHTSELQSH